MRYTFAITMLFLVLNFIKLDAQQVEVTITGIRNTKGQIVLGIFKDDPTFQKEDAFLSLSFPKKEIMDGVMKVSFSLEPGVWGVTLLDDENLDGKMEYNFLGIPREGFGFSDYYSSGFSKPKFDNFKFTLDKGQKKKITVKVRYI